MVKEERFMLLDNYECVNSTLHFGIVIFVNTLCALLHSKYFIQKYSGWSVLKGQHPVKKNNCPKGNIFLPVFIGHEVHLCF